MHRAVFGVIVALALSGGHANAAPTPEGVARELLAAFTSTPNQTPNAEVSEREYVGFRTQTVTFSIGRKIYRVVFSSDGTIDVALTQAGELGSQTLWSLKSRETSVEQIVNLIYSREMGRAYAGSKLSQDQARKDPPVRTDREADAVRGRKIRTGSDVGWNQLMNRVLSGDVASLAGGNRGGADKGLNDAVNLARMLDPCAQSKGSASAQRSAITDIAEAMTKADLKLGRGSEGTPEFLLDRSRNFDVAGSYSFTKELDKFESAPTAEEVFHLIQQSRSDTYELFKAAIRNSETGSRDPYALAALRNFKSVARGTTEDAGRRMVDDVLGRIVVDLASFTKLRAGIPNTLVVYDRTSNRFFVDPTLTSPSQARYLLSVAVLYDWALKKPQTQKLISQYTDAQKKVALIENAVLDETDARELASRRAQSAALAKKMFELSESLRMAPSLPVP